MRNSTKKKIGIMGGTFDPIHYGHLLIAQSAVEDFGIDTILFMPTGESPHKETSQVTSPKIRCEMSALAIAENPHFLLSAFEAENTGINYTYRTLTHFKKEYPNTEFFFIMGEDSLNDFSKWKEPQEICDLATLLVAVRNNGDSDIDKQIEYVKNTYHADIYKLTSPNFAISSREIREKIHSGKSVRYMIPDTVYHYICTNNLYSK